MTQPVCTYNLPKSVMISGASGAIGSALCVTLASLGVRIVAVGRSETKLTKLVASLSCGASWRHQFLTLDFSDEGSITNFGQELVSRRLYIDGVVVNPPRISPRSDSFPKTEDWNSIFQATFLGPLRFLEFSVESIRQCESEIKRIAIISGISSKQVLSHYSMNNAIRSAWAAQAKTLAFALGPESIHVNTLSIGGALTPVYRSQIVKKAKNAGITLERQLELETANIPLRKYATIDEIVNGLMGLLSGFTDYMTGVNFPFEGGYLAHY